jgi:hypothetical protein
MFFYGGKENAYAKDTSVKNFDKKRAAGVFS